MFIKTGKSNKSLSICVWSITKVIKLEDHAEYNVVIFSAVKRVLEYIISWNVPS